METSKAPRTSPCLGCPDRHTACHDTCEKYQAYRQGREELYEQRVKGIEIAAYIKGRREIQKRRRKP